MQFEWDEDKNTANIRKHRIDFADVPTIFNGPLLVEYDDREDYGEARWRGIGMLKSILVVVVVFTEKETAAIRIISARKANQYERKQYEKYLKD